MESTCKTSKETLERMKKACKEVLPDLDEAGVTEATRLKEDLSLNSLTMMMLAVSVEEEFEFRFDEFPEFVTVGDICAYAEAHAGEHKN